MTSIQNAKTNMYHVVIAICNDNSSIISSIPALQAASDSFAAIVGSIAGIAQQKSKVISGITTAKSSVRKILIQQAAEIAANVFAFAFAKGNETLKEQVNYTVTSLGRHSDEALMNVCTNIAGTVTANVTALAPFNITAATVTGFSALLDQFRSEASRPRIAISARVAHAEMLETTFLAADTFLKYQLDKIVLSLTSTQSAFVSAYNAARTIVNPRTSITQVKGKITSAITALPVIAATIEIVTTTISANTSKTGTYTLKPVPHGVYEIKITKTGYEQKILTKQTIKLGHVNTIDAELTPTQE